MMLRWLPAAAALALAAKCTHASSTEKDAICASDADGGCVAPTAPSLLQKKVSKHDTKGVQPQELLPPSVAPNADCAGTTAQGRCWFLSDIGESCAATCSKHGRSFSYAIASPEAPLTPRLVFHEPKTKQEPWAALECYVASEDRYHTANENAARHTADEVGDFSHENCMLACPCGGAGSAQCTWKQPAACVDKFMWKGVEYSGCATVDIEHERPWCQHNYQHTDKDSGQDWSYCESRCESDEPARPKEPVEEARPKEPVEECMWIPAYSCAREFSYEGTQYVGCTAADHDTPWCSNTETYYGSWSRCVYMCPSKPEPPLKPVDPPLKPVERVQNCTWQPKADCAKTFEYKGRNVEGCTDLDNPTPWCSRDAIHRDSWDTCTRVCSSEPVVPSPVHDGEDPCTRHPDVENDLIGNSAPLDEAGYRITAAAESPINMKRFVCRVAAMLGCKVVDEAALYGFVPYYSGLVKTQTYSTLEFEVETLCHAGGKWVTVK